MAIAEWTRQADSDLDEIYLHIARADKRPSVAKEMEAGIVNHCNQYATYFAEGHTLGTARPDLAAGVRTVAYQRWVIIFRPVDSGIQVLRVFDGSRKYDELFRQNPGS